MCGLCGNFDGDHNNDFQTHTQDVVMSAIEFGNNWRYKSTCPEINETSAQDTCEKYPNRRSWTIRQCYIIKSDVFADCHNEVCVLPCKGY